MKASALALVLALVSANAEANGKDVAEDYRTLATGSEEVIELDFVPEQTNLTSSVLQVAPGARPNELRLTALSPGKSAFVIRNKKGELLKKMKYHVITNEQFQHLDGVRRLLKDVDGIKIEFVDRNIVVDGVASPSDFKRIEKLEQAYPELLNLVRSQ